MAHFPRNIWPAAVGNAPTTLVSLKSAPESGYQKNILLPINILSGLSVTQSPKAQWNLFQQAVD